MAIAADLLAIAAAELGAISERRTERLVNPSLSGLPAFLAREGGLHSGLMMAHVTAAALASENKVLAHPASVDSIPTSAGKEDHVSMGPTAARKAARVVANTRRVLAVELLAACQALEFRRPLRSSPALEAVAGARPRRRCRPTGRTGSSAPEIEALAGLLGRDALARRGRVGLRYAGVACRALSTRLRRAALARRGPAPGAWPPASSRRSPTRSACAPLAPRSSGLGAGLVLLFGGLERLWQRRPLPRPHRAADRTPLPRRPGRQGQRPRSRPRPRTARRRQARGG